MADDKAKEGDNSQALALRQAGPTEIALSDATEKLMVMGDLTGLTADQRVEYYRAVAESIGVDWRRKPFDYLVVKAEGGANKLILYANHACADMIADSRAINCQILDRREEDGLYVVEVRASLPSGRYHDASAYVPVETAGGQWKTVTNRQGEEKRVFEQNGEYRRMRGVDLANAKMKCETKAYRRAILALTGMSAWADEPPPGSVRVDVDITTGIEQPPDPREEAIYQPTRAASTRFHTTAGFVEPAVHPEDQGAAPEGPEPADEPDGDGEQDDTGAPSAIIAGMLDAVRTQFFGGKELQWNNDKAKRAGHLSAANGQLRLHGYTPIQMTALYAAMHYAGTGETLTKGDVDKGASVRCFTAVEALGTPQLNDLRGLADWWLQTHA